MSHAPARSLSLLSTIDVIIPSHRSCAKLSTATTHTCTLERHVSLSEFLIQNKFHYTSRMLIRLVLHTHVRWQRHTAPLTTNCLLQLPDQMCRPSLDRNQLLLELMRTLHCIEEPSYRLLQDHCGAIKSRNLLGQTMHADISDSVESGLSWEHAQLQRAVLHVLAHA